MARYYLVILIFNTLFALFFYFKVKNTGLSSKAFIFIALFSVLIGAFFPLLVGFFNLYVVIGINLFAVGIGVLLAAQFEVAPAVERIDVEEHILGPIEEEPVATEEPAAPAESEAAVIEREVHEQEEIVDEEIEEEIEEEYGIEVEEVEEETEEPLGQVDQLSALVDDRPLSDDESDRQGENIMSVKGLHVDGNLDLLDSYIQRGFDAKAEGKLDLGIKYFASALELNPPFDLETMMFFDVVAMLKETGQYQKAREFLEEFETEKSTDLSPSIAREIMTNLKYLEILQEMLLKANTPNLPFSMVPALIRMSVEEKVNQWKNEVF